MQEDFGGRARWGKTFSGDTDEDEKGHGTHCAGIAGGTRFGVAKDVALIAVKVRHGTDSDGTADECLQGLEWVHQQAQSTGNPSVVNLSFGHPADPEDTPIDLAVTALINAGIHVVIAAGNKDWNVRQTTPGRVPAAITVASSTIDDARAQSSNYGIDIDLFAPGEKITSTWIGSTTATKVKSGTSMAAPHVTGLVAYLIMRYGNKTPAGMKTFVDKLSLKGALKTDTLKNSPNKLARNDVNNPNFDAMFV